MIALGENYLPYMIALRENYLPYIIALVENGEWTALSQICR